jgi:hypothetical protein
MPQYVIRLTHPPDQCPTANGKIRDLFTKAASTFPQLAQKLKVNFVAGPLILGAEHESIAVAEADTIETIEEFVLQSGLIQWNTVRVAAAMSLEEAMQRLERVPPPIY